MMNYHKMFKLSYANNNNLLLSSISLYIMLNHFLTESHGSNCLVCLDKNRKNGLDNTAAMTKQVKEQQQLNDFNEW